MPGISLPAGVGFLRCSTAICPANSWLHQHHFDALHDPDLRLAGSPQNRSLPPPSVRPAPIFHLHSGSFLAAFHLQIAARRWREACRSAHPALSNSRSFRGMRTTNISPAGQWVLLTIVSPWIPQSRDPPPPALSVPGGADGEMELRRGSVPHAGDHE